MKKRRHLDRSRKILDAKRSVSANTAITTAPASIGSRVNDTPFACGNLIQLYEPNG